MTKKITKEMVAKAQADVVIRPAGTENVYAESPCGRRSRKGWVFGNEHDAVISALIDEVLGKNVAANCPKDLYQKTKKRVEREYKEIMEA